MSNSTQQVLHYVNTVTGGIKNFLSSSGGQWRMFSVFQIAVILKFGNKFIRFCANSEKIGLIRGRELIIEDSRRRAKDLRTRTFITFALSDA